VTKINEQLLESEGLVLHSDIEIMIDREKLLKDHHERTNHEPTIIDKLTG